MEWVGGNVIVSHPRENWGRDEESATLVHCRLGRLKGKDYTGARRREYSAAYEAAKLGFDLDAAFSIMDRCVDNRVTDAIVDAMIAQPSAPVIVYPHPNFDDDDAVDCDATQRHMARNAVPVAYASYLSEVTGCPVNDQIVQSARVGRTKLNGWLRFLCQPSFIGPVTPGQSYIIVDDVVTTGGTFAALRSFIVRNGGTVAITSAFAHKTGTDQRFAVARQTLESVRSIYGAEVAGYWRETMGHGIECLTEAEANLLARWGRQREADGCTAGDEVLRCLRDRINEAAAKGE